MKTIVLTGGTSKRFGKDKSTALINGKTLLEILTDGLEDLVIVGPETSVVAKYIRENPIGAGPVAAIGAGLKEVDTELVAIFATDMPFAPRILKQLIQALINDAALPIDCDGYAQPLAAIYRTSALKKAIDSFDSLENRSVKELISKLNIDRVPLVETEFLLDIDTQVENRSVKELISKLNIDRVPLVETEFLLDIDTQADLVKAIDLASRLAL